jgi:phosphatidate cytidylyltransferase
MEKELQKRIGTACVGGFVLVTLVVSGGFVGIFLIYLAMALGMVFEFSKIAFSLSDRLDKRYLLLVLAWLMAFCHLLLPQMELGLLMIAFFFLSFYFLFTAQFHEQALSVHFQEWSYAFFGLVYLVELPFYLVKLHQLGFRWVLLLFALVWSGDSAAYFLGKRYGRRLLYLQISPKKTIEGAWGGCLVSLLLGLVGKFFLFQDVSWWVLVLMVLLVSVFSQVGDLCESFLKRAFHCKDSGSWLPGHGGFLDRFDGLIFAAPVLYVCARWWSGA